MDLNLFSSHLERYEAHTNSVTYCLTLTTAAQIIPKQDIKPVLIRSGLLMLSGSCDATAEVLRIDYSKFRAVHPRANEDGGIRMNLA